jgi:hypothetical protein
MQYAFLRIKPRLGPFPVLDSARRVGLKMARGARSSLPNCFSLWRAWNYVRFGPLRDGLADNQDWQLGVMDYGVGDAA